MALIGLKWALGGPKKLKKILEKKFIEKLLKIVESCWKLWKVVESCGLVVAEITKELIWRKICEKAVAVTGNY